MATTATSYEHITLDDHGTPVIEGTRLRVIDLMMARRVDGLSPEKLQEQYPTLTMGQIYSALAYYYDHQA